MKISSYLIRALILLSLYNASIVLADGGGSKFPDEYKYNPMTENEKTEYRQVEQAATAFAESHILGTGETQTFSGIMSISKSEAVAFLGASDDEKDGVMTYKVNLQKIFNKWRVISYEHGKNEHIAGRILKFGIYRLDEPYPMSVTERKKFYKEFGTHFSRYDEMIYITMDSIKKYANDNSVVIGQVQKNETSQFARTEVVVYGRSERDISKYRTDSNYDMPDMFILEATPFEACGKTIVRARIGIGRRNDRLQIPQSMDMTNISFILDGKKFSCEIHDVN